MKNILTLHEAVAVVLLSQPDKTATFHTIASVVEKEIYFLKEKEESL